MTPFMTDRPMWCDSFDSDLPKVVPGAKEALGGLAALELQTHGTTTNGTLNHPSVWNDYSGMIAFFGSAGHGAGKPPHYHSGEPIVRCTLWEAVRDAWVHSYIIVLNGRPVWDAFALQDSFYALMYHVRGIQALPPSALDRQRRRVLGTLEHLHHEVARAGVPVAGIPGT